tara:strand:- start:216 stop:713 length:498 start_codon:yes stop_codon:yes gene_type:complete
MPQKKHQQKETQVTSTKSGQTSKQRIAKCTDKTPFKSIHKAGYVTPGNYIAELIFQKRNEHFNSGKNAESFWLKGNKLHGAYKGEVIAANKLLKDYHADSVIKAIRSPQAKFILKLSKKENRNKLIPIIEKFEKERKEKEIVASDNTKVEISKPFSQGKNILKGL